MKEIKFSSQEAVERFKTFLSLLSTDIQEGYNNLKFQIEDKRLLLIHLTSYYQAQLSLDLKEPLEKVLWSTKLSLVKDILGNLPELSLKFNEEFLELKDSNSTENRFLLPLSLEKSDSIPPLKEEEEGKTFSAEKFRESWNFLSSLSEDENRGINFILSGGRIEALSYSMKRAGYLVWEGESELREIEKIFVLSKKQFSLVSKLFRISEDVQIFFSKDVIIKGKDFVFTLNEAVSKALTQNQVLSLFNFEPDLSFKISSKELLKTINRAMLILSRSNEKVKILLKKDQIQISIYSPVNGWGEIKLDLHVEGIKEEVSIEISLETLGNLLRRLEGEVKVHFLRNRNVCVLECLPVKYLFLY